MTDPWKINVVEHSTHDEIAVYSLYTVLYADLRAQETERLEAVKAAIDRELSRREDPQMGADS